MQYSTTQYNRIQLMQCNTIKKLYNTIKYNTMQNNTMHYNTIHCTIQYNTIQCNAMQYNTIQDYLVAIINELPQCIKGEQLWMNDKTVATVRLSHSGKNTTCILRTLFTKQVSIGPVRSVEDLHEGQISHHG